jgi:UDP-GlcNAc:undecaprenyl-phosphate GlcNAc-1-phosphate transferase
MILAFGATLAGGVAATWLVRAAARRVGFVNEPNPIVPQHRKAVAYGGGLSVILALGVGLAMSQKDLCLLAPAGLAVLLGTLDDALRLPVAAKLAGQAVVAASLLAVAPVPFMTGFPQIDAAVACLAAIILMNAANLADVCDGLVGGLGAIALGALAVAADSLTLGLAAASLLAFLLFNLPPASIFLGDAGSHLVGLLLSFGALAVIERDGALAGGLISLLATAVFIFELVFLAAVRARKGLPFWRGSPDHFSLRLQAGPFSRRQTVAISWATGAVVGAAAIFAHLSPPWVGRLFAAATFVMALAAACRLLRWEVR